MVTLSPSLLVLTGIITTAVAQVFLKKAAGFEIKTSPWVIWMGLSAAAYTVREKTGLLPDIVPR